LKNELLILLTVVAPLLGAIASLSVQNNRGQRWLGIWVGLITWASSLILFYDIHTHGPQVYQLGGWHPPFGIVLVGDMLSGLFVVMASSVLLGGLIYILDCKDKSLNHPSFITMFLAMETGLLGAFLTGDIFTLFVFMELMVISSVSMVAIADNQLGLEAALKYIFISSMGTLFLLIGIAAIYATFGTLNFADLANQLALGERPLLAQASAVLLMGAFMLKSAVFPFHFWQPDFHTTAPTPLSAMLSSVVVKVGIYGILRITTLLFVAEAATIRQLLIILGLISIYFGGLSALRTQNGKRLLAYSTLSQIGFILVAIGWGTPLALTAAIVYAFNHAFIKSALLLLMGVIASHTQTKTARLSDLAGAGKAMPVALGVLYILGGMALAGLPPMNGFISKFLLVQSGIGKNDWLALGLAIAGGLLTLLYMVRTWQLIFQQKPDASAVALKPRHKADSYLAPALLIAVCLGLGIYATPLYEMASKTVDQMRDTQIYVDAVALPDADTMVEVRR
jgi:multicomponent Na+:H+ antiporter subunit D